MPDGIGSLYPRPPENPLSNPLNVVGLMRGLQEFGIRQEQAPALGQIPALEAQRAQQAIYQSAYGAIAPRIAQQVQALGDNATDNDYHNIFVNAATAGGAPPDITGQIVGSLHSVLDGNGTLKDRRMRAAQLASSFIAPGTQITGITPTGTPQSIPLASAPSGVITGLGPGGTELQKDQLNSAAILKNLQPYEIALPIMEQLNNKDFGPASPAFSRIRSMLISVGALSPDEKASNQSLREAANKYLHQYVASSVGPVTSDYRQEFASISNPSLDLTQPAAIKLLKNQVARDRMTAALPGAFKEDVPNDPYGSNYLGYKSNYYQQHNLNAYQYDMMNRGERGQMLSTLGPPQLDEKGVPRNPRYKQFVDSWRQAQRILRLNVSREQQQAQSP